MNELIVANKALHEPLDDDLSTLVGDDTRFKVRSVSQFQALVRILGTEGADIEMLYSMGRSFKVPECVRALFTHM